MPVRLSQSPVRIEEVTHTYAEPVGRNDERALHVRTTEGRAVAGSALRCLRQAQLTFGRTVKTVQEFSRML